MQRYFRALAGFILILTTVVLMNGAPIARADETNVILSIVKQAISDAPNNFAHLQGGLKSNEDSAYGSTEYDVSQALRTLCDACDMSINHWNTGTEDAATRSTLPEYWQFSLGIGIGTVAPAGVPALIRKNLTPVIPSSYRYMGVIYRDKIKITMRWLGGNGTLINLDSTPSGYGTKWVSVIAVRHLLAR